MGIDPILIYAALLLGAVVVAVGVACGALFLREAARTGTGPLGLVIVLAGFPLGVLLDVPQRFDPSINWLTILLGTGVAVLELMLAVALVTDRVRGWLPVSVLGAALLFLVGWLASGSILPGLRPS